jgi:guanine deaminase
MRNPAHPEHEGGITRRRVAVGGLAGLVASACARPAAAGAGRPEIVQPRRPGPEGFAERAFELRRLAVERGDQPYGAVVVKAGRVVGEGASAVVTDTDPTAHAEMLAIRDAARRLGTRDLSGAELYGTSRACTMCEAGAYWARIDRMYYGTPVTDAGVPRLR